MKMENLTQAQSKPVRRLPARGLLVLGAAAVLGAGGVWWLNAAHGSVTTDNAYLKTDVTVVAPRVRGHVVQVLVSENQPVKAGQVLVRLDADEYAARAAEARGELAMAEAGLAAAEAALARHEADEALAFAAVREAQTGIAAADAEAVRARADWTRYDALLKTGYAPRRDADRVQAQAVAAGALAERSRAALAVTRSQAEVVRGRKAELAAAVAEARARREAAAAAVTLASQDQAHVEIRAPVDGVVGDRQANVGDYVQPGSRLLVVSPTNQIYLTANFKETQTARMLRGQPARVKVDALPGVTLKAHVESFAPGTGSEFALLPFEPGVGNFTKIVQRVPVRLRFDAGQPELAKLRPGLSAKVTVDFEGD